MTNITYELEDGEVKKELKTKLSRNIQVVEHEGVLYGIIGGARYSVDYEFASEEDGYDGHTYHTVIVKPNELYTNIRLEKIARQNIEPGDSLVAVVLNGSAPAKCRYPYQGNIVLISGKVTLIKNQ